MIKKELLKTVKCEACRIGVEEEALLAFIEIESGGKGFVGNKLIIQFEPSYFYKKTKVKIKNGVSGQAVEWKAFNEAFAIDPNAAMESTSIGLGLVMGSHWKRLGYKSIGEMWDDAKKGEDRQVFQMTEFINTDKRLLLALKNKDWHKVATYYNGAGYRNLAARLGRTPYDISMKRAYEKYKKERE